MAPAADPVTPVYDMARMALSGDPVMLRALAAAIGGFSIRLAAALAILAVTLWLARRLGRVAERAISRVHRNGQAPDQTLAAFLSGLVRYVIIGIGLVAVLQQLGVQATSVLAVLGAASLAIGLALQGTLGNVAAGVMILILRPYRTGDQVEVNGRSGTVRGLDLFNTRLVDYDGLTVFLPNGKVFGDTIVNISRGGRRRIELHFGVDYEDDLDAAIATLIELARADPRVLDDPEPWAKVTALADSSVTVTLRCWAQPQDWVNTRYDLVKAAKAALEAAGLSFPYPHQVQLDRKDTRPAPGAVRGEPRTDANAPGAP
ncbi:MAG: mechanosensitive ion channel family protein [Phenylobacterium sp.]|uniref:mechanosensitive ion channel family protein n=1 Tax=Phenylobacterium sp. TaxID=1871053 RepID=UPI001A546444|nr:mechanosensitive ion channel family protein [Phenylobacterium sp.]MBL8773489.1 mechanosensitive ion channel family protein [Phenylobacterium sp.]